MGEGKRKRILKRNKLYYIHVPPPQDDCKWHVLIKKFLKELLLSFYCTINQTDDSKAFFDLLCEYSFTLCQISTLFYDYRNLDFMNTVILLRVPWYSKACM